MKTDVPPRRGTAGRATPAQTAAGRPPTETAAGGRSGRSPQRAVDGPPSSPSPPPPPPPPPENDVERRRRRAQFLRDLAEARELRDRVQPRRAKAARLRHALRMRTFRW
ncbi:hypothetical protein FGD71_028880 [Streptomyces sporangiiformans]|uniref:Uncharacterized protein n=1 Tax=Streptomyces sporangiiformans TaxID=2315329 RepID=A0A505D363_9ACTN|nr:hypothetical protein FGD71_028880 [Streptomyces sporangiiformans]